MTQAPPLDPSLRRFATVKEAAALLSITRSYAYQLVREGKIPAYTTQPNAAKHHIRIWLPDILVRYPIPPK